MDKDTFDDDIIGYGMYNVAQYMSQRMNTTGNNYLIQLQSISPTKMDMLVELLLLFNSREE